MNDLFSAPQAAPAAVDARTGNASLSQFFTPFWAAEELVDDVMRDLGRVSVVEPSCGTGSFLSTIPQDCPAFGVDIDPAVVPAAIRNSGREVLIGDFRTIDLDGRQVELVIGNPPFEMEIIEGFLDRAHEILPADGLAAFILPAYSFQTPSRVSRWLDRFSLDVRLIPRTLFDSLSKPLVFAKFIKTNTTRSVHGLMLFAETREIENMRPAIRDALARPGTWREAVSIALRSLGGQASLSAIYDAIAPERHAARYWREKVRQTLGRGGFKSLGDGRWALSQEYALAA